eukprot:6213496-Pleurochrysis_carterae.AAC.3
MMPQKRAETNAQSEGANGGDGPALKNGQASAPRSVYPYPSALSLVLQLPQGFVQMHVERAHFLFFPII